MNRTEQAIAIGARLKPWLRWAIAWLGSLKLAVVLLAILAAVIATATILEADHGRAYAQWYVYHSGWFVALLALLGVTIFCAAIARWPWRRHHTGFVVTHGGLLVLLAGSIQTFVGGVEGHVTLGEGEATTKLTIAHQSQITVFWADRPEEPPYVFSFQPGPRDWRAGTSLDMGQVEGIGVRVLHYYSHAQVREDWVADESGTGGPAVRFEIVGPRGSARLQQLLVDQDSGEEIFVGPIRLQLQRAATDAMLTTFLEPPTDNLGPQGILLAYYGNRVERIPVDGNIGKKVVLGDTGIAVEIAEYLPNAKPDPHGRFQSLNAEPRNPLLELKVHLPDARQPLRQLAFAKSPLLNLDAVYGRVCPVTFHYHHPAVEPSTAIELLQTSDGKLYGRRVADKRITPMGEVQAGSAIPMPGNFTVTVVEHLPHARQQISFEPLAVDANERDKAEAAAELEVSAAGVTEKLWLQRNHPSYGTRTAITPEGALRIHFGYAEVPLGFAMNLLDFRRGLNPGGVGNATFSSRVRLTDQHHGVDEEREVSMNEPLTHNRWTFYQSGFQEAEHGAQSSTFSVAYDPGRATKYAGCLLICLGIATMFYMRAYFFQNVPALAKGRFTFRGERVSPVGLLSDPEPVKDSAPQAAARSGVDDGELVPVDPGNVLTEAGKSV